MKTRAFTCPSSGFTLIELVISSALMVLILAGGYLCLHSGFLSQKLVESRADAAQRARIALAFMTADLRSACALSKDIPFLGMHRLLGEREADNLDFGTHNYTPRRLREGDFCEVSYFAGAEQNGSLTLWRRRDTSPDDEPLSGGSREEIARGVRYLKFEYYDGFDWYDEWGDATGKRKKDTSRLEHPNLYGMPEAVRITLALEPTSSGKPDTDAEPMVFQTVARLNLAAASQKESSSTSSKGDGNSQNQPPEGAPTQPGGEQ
jgi:prepilin-type N-terminal cleavage/methylation domain-containing protein